MRYILLPFLIFFACNPASKETTTTDSLTVADTAMDAVETEDASDEFDLAEASDTSQLNRIYEEISLKNSDAANEYYQVSIEGSQYEASYTVTWYFDSEFAPRYFLQNWSAEGNEGSTEFFVKEGVVICAQEDDGYESAKWCIQTGGTVTQWSDESDDATVQMLPDDFGTACNERLENFLNTLRQLLREGEIVTDDDGSVTIRMEKTVDVGMEFTESVEVLIPKAVYDALK